MPSDLFLESADNLTRPKEDVVYITLHSGKLQARSRKRATGLLILKAFNISLLKLCMHGYGFHSVLHSILF